MGPAPAAGLRILQLQPVPWEWQVRHMVHTDLRGHCQTWLPASQPGMHQCLCIWWVSSAGCCCGQTFECALPPELDRNGAPPAGEHQRVNAALAVALCGAWEQGQARPAQGRDERVKQLQSMRLPAAYAQGLLTCHWPGRSQVRARMQVVGDVHGLSACAHDSGGKQAG